MSTNFKPCASCVGCTFSKKGSCEALTQPALNKLGVCKFKKTPTQKSVESKNSANTLYSKYSKTSEGRSFLREKLKKYDELRAAFRTEAPIAYSILRNS